MAGDNSIFNLSAVATPALADRIAVGQTVVGDSLYYTRPQLYTLLAGEQLTVDNAVLSAPSITGSNAASGIYFAGAGFDLGISRNGATILASKANNVQLHSSTVLGWTDSDAMTGTLDLALIREATGILAQRNGVNAQESRLYETFSDASNYARLALITTAGDYTITPQAAGTGTLRGLVLGASGVDVKVPSGGHLVLPQADEAATPTIAFGDGDTGFYEDVDDSIEIAHAGVTKWRFNGSQFGHAASSRGPMMQAETPTSTNPVFVFSGDTDTGLGKNADNQVSLIAGATEGIRVNTAASGVNYLDVTPSATGSPVLVGAGGTDTNIQIDLVPKGTGDVRILGSSATLVIGTGGSIRDAGTKLDFNDAAGTTGFFRVDTNTGDLTFFNSGGTAGATWDRSAAAFVSTKGIFGVATATEILSSAGLEVHRAGDAFVALVNTNAAGVGNGGAFSFMAKDTGGGTDKIAQVLGLTEATHATQSAGLLRFDTAPAGGVVTERMRISSIGDISFPSGGHLVAPQVDEPATPTLQIGAEGLYSRVAGELNISIGAGERYVLSASSIQSRTNSGFFVARIASSATVPAHAFRADEGTGMGRAGAGALSLIANSVEAVRYTEASSHIVHDDETHAGITASTTQTQGNGVLLSSHNEISTVANANDTVTLPTAAAGRHCLVINNGANDLQVFPASGDDLGMGVDTSQVISAGQHKDYFAIDATNWSAGAVSENAHGEMFDEANTDAFVITATLDHESYHTNGLAGGQQLGWTFDAGGGGTSFPIASIADGAASGVDIAVTTTGSHGLAVGDIVSQSDLTSAVYTGIFVVKAIISATVYEVAAVFTATDTGTMNQAATLTADASEAGDYIFMWQMSATSASSNVTFDFILYRGATAVPGGTARRKFGTGGDFGMGGGQGIIAIAGGDKISLAVANQSGAGNITLRNFTLSLHRV